MRKRTNRDESRIILSVSFLQSFGESFLIMKVFGIWFGDFGLEKQGRRRGKEHKLFEQQWTNCLKNR
jgi:hypothetical protein